MSDDDDPEPHQRPGRPMHEPRAALEAACPAEGVQIGNEVLADAARHSAHQIPDDARRSELHLHALAALPPDLPEPLRTA